MQEATSLNLTCSFFHAIKVNEFHSVVMEEAMPGRSKEETRPKREAILDAARTLFVQKGYEETTIAEIAQAAGVAVRTVYLYFRNKHEILTGAALHLEAN